MRFLQTQEYRPVGSKKILRANVRVIAATNADLKQLVQHKKFREDLFFRLNVLNLTMPPLRERKADMAIIAESLLQRFSHDYDLPVRPLSQQSLQYLQQQNWPGNVREFENTLLRSYLLSVGNYIEIDDDVVPNSFASAADVESDAGVKPRCAPMSFQDAKAQAIVDFEQHYLREVMHITHGNVTLAAKIAGKERRALGKLLQKYAIDKSQYR